MLGEARMHYGIDLERALGLRIPPQVMKRTLTNAKVPRLRTGKTENPLPKPTIIRAVESERAS